ncbi:hypothetical protein BH23BAC3_BH23BAC3_14840 [soil metagenome]
MNPLFYFIHMTTPAKRHFPQFRFRDGSKWLFNPVLKKRFANRPEERVRLRFVDYLLSETDFNKNRIGFEAPIKLPEAENTLRADLVLYNRSMKPFALIECKSENIKLTYKTAEQVTRYNRRLNAEYLMMTNGNEEIWYNIGEQITVLVKSPLDQNKIGSENAGSAAYWVDRGFISANSTEKTKRLALEILQPFRQESGSDRVQYLDLPSTLAPFPLGHYYHISTIEPECKMGISILDNGSDSTILCGVLNRAGKNQGIIWATLDNLAASSGEEATVISPSGRRTIELPATFSRELMNKDERFLKNLGGQLLLFFD